MGERLTNRRDEENVKKGQKAKEFFFFFARPLFRYSGACEHAVKTAPSLGAYEVWVHSDIVTKKKLLHPLIKQYDSYIHKFCFHR